MVVCPLGHPNFLFNLRCFHLHDAHKISFPHLLALGLFHCICGQCLNPMGIHSFIALMVGEKMMSHDAIWNVIASIAKDVGFHVANE
jgi:hypothetical protein